MNASAQDPAASSPFVLIGGHRVLEAICERFYDLMDEDAAYAQLRALHAEDLGMMRKALPRFLAGLAGGPRDWFEANPGKCMVSLHAAFPIDRQSADQWAEAMTCAIAQTEMENRDVANAMAEVLSRMARTMARST